MVRVAYRARVRSGTGPVATVQGPQFSVPGLDQVAGGADRADPGPHGEFRTARTGHDRAARGQPMKVDRQARHRVGGYRGRCRLVARGTEHPYRDRHERRPAPRRRRRLETHAVPQAGRVVALRADDLVQHRPIERIEREGEHEETGDRRRPGEKQPQVGAVDQARHDERRENDRGVRGVQEHGSSRGEEDEEERHRRQRRDSWHRVERGREPRRHHDGDADVGVGHEPRRTGGDPRPGVPRQSHRHGRQTHECGDHVPCGRHTGRRHRDQRGESDEHGGQCDVAA